MNKSSLFNLYPGGGYFLKAPLVLLNKRPLIFPHFNHPTFSLYMNLAMTNVLTLHSYAAVNANRDLPKDFFILNIPRIPHPQGSDILGLRFGGSNVNCVDALVEGRTFN